MLETLLRDPEVLRKLPESVKRASAGGRLHEVVLQKLAAEGNYVLEFSPETALKNLGKKIFLKNAQWGLVRQGLDALEDL